MSSFAAFHELLDKLEKEKNEEIARLKKRIAELEQSKSDLELKLTHSQKQQTSLAAELERTKSQYVLQKPHNFQPNILKAAKSGDIESIKYILYENPQQIGFQSEEGLDSALHEAVWHGKTDVVNFLLSKGAYVNIRNRIYYSLIECKHRFTTQQ